MRHKSALRYSICLPGSHTQYPPGHQTLYLPARFTVEAALLMTIILPVLIAILMAGFYLHDEVYLQGICQEAAEMAINLKDEKTADAKAGKLLNQRLSSALVWGRDSSGDISGDGNEVRVSCTAAFVTIEPYYPGKEYLAGRLMGSCTRRIYDPADLIRKVRGIQYLADELLG